VRVLFENFRCSIEVTSPEKMANDGSDVTPQRCTGRRRGVQTLDEFQPTSTSSSTKLCRAQTVGAIPGRAGYDGVADSLRVPATTGTGSYSAHLRRAAAAVNGSSRSQLADSTADPSGAAGALSAATDCRSDVWPVPGEDPPVHELARSFPGRSNHEAAAPEVRRTSTLSNSHYVQSANDRPADLGDHVTAVPGPPRRSVTSGSDCNETSLTRTSTFSAAADSRRTSTGYASAVADGGGLSPTVLVNVDSRASASPQLRRRWQRCPDTGSRNSTAVQAAGVDQHHYLRLRQPEPEHAQKPHSVPCSPRLQARLAATQPWRPWSPSTPGVVLARPFQTIDVKTFKLLVILLLLPPPRRLCFHPCLSFCLVTGLLINY